MNRQNSRNKRVLRNRSKLRKINTNRFRITVSKSLKHISAQIIDDKISKVFFDRGGYKYHGRIKALADSLRKNGLNFWWEIVNL